MFQLAFSEKSLDVQRNVVTEEFRQTHLNQPYGDVWLLLRPLAYKVHPYQWSTIGKEISHIQNAVMDDVKAFYKKFYNPNNAILVVAGNVETAEIKVLAEKWFGPIQNDDENLRNIPEEPPQTEARLLVTENNVPLDAIYKAWHMCGRMDAAYHPTDLLSDILSNGNSSRLYNELVKNKKLFSDLNAYILGSSDEGLFVVSGKLVKGVKLEDADAAIIEELDKMKTGEIDERELQKVKNKIEANLEFSEMNVLEKAMNLAFAELMGNAADVNEEGAKYQAVTAEQIRETARQILRPENCSTLYYKSQSL
jgi:predicted Zn-dependent peptidase